MPLVFQVQFKHNTSSVATGRDNLGSLHDEVGGAGLLTGGRYLPANTVFRTITPFRRRPLHTHRYMHMLDLAFATC